MFNFRTNGNANLGFQAVYPKESSTCTLRSEGNTVDPVIAFNAKPDALVTMMNNRTLFKDSEDVHVHVEVPVIAVEVSRK